MREYQGPDLPRAIVPNCEGKHCYCKRTVNGQAYCCRCHYEPDGWMEIEGESCHNDKILNGGYHGKRAIHAWQGTFIPQS